MAKIVEDQAPPPPKKSKLPLIIVILVVSVGASGAGIATPLLFGSHSSTKASDTEKTPGPQDQAELDFGLVTVNLKDGRYARFLRTKIVLVVDEKDVKTVTDQMAKMKSTLMTWVNGYLADQTLESLHGSAGMHRVRREIRDEFNARFFGDGPEKIKDILLPEYIFQI